MPEYTPEELREQLLTPLTMLLSDFSQAIGRMDSLRKEGKLPGERIALRAVGAIGAIKTLRKLKRELNDKLEAATDGTLEDLEKKRRYMQEMRTQEAAHKKHKI